VAVLRGDFLGEREIGLDVPLLQVERAESPAPSLARASGLRLRDSPGTGFVVAAPSNRSRICFTNAARPALLSTFAASLSRW
jgi:hypothetical protein